MMQQDAQTKWVQSKNDECWICERWKYVLIFHTLDHKQLTSVSERKAEELTKMNKEAIKDIENYHQSIKEISNQQFHLLGGTFTHWKLT